MKKQYRDTYHNWHSFNFCIYHDGKLVESKIVDLSDIDFEIDKLEDMGYRLCYTKDEVEEAKQTYLHMLENILEEK